MIRLVRVELTRYRTRRMIALLVALTALLAAVVAFESAWDTRPPSKLDIATAQARADDEAQRSDIRNDLAKCRQSPTDYLGPGATQENCSDALVAASDSYLPRDTLDLTGTLKGNGLGLAVLVIALLVIAASTFAGADWGSGSLANQLIFETRRDRVFAAKAIAVSLASGLVALVAVGGFWLTLYLVASDRGLPHGSAVMDDIAWHLGRTVLLAMGAGLGAFALTMLLKHSVATLSVLFAYSIGGELVVGLLPIDGIGRWSLGNNVFGWLETRLDFFDCAHLGSCAGPEHISHLHSGIYLLVVLVVAVATSWLVFRRRDV